jgi:hypothetical protein
VHHTCVRYQAHFNGLWYQQNFRTGEKREYGEVLRLFGNFHKYNEIAVEDDIAGGQRHELPDQAKAPGKETSAMTETAEQHKDALDCAMVYDLPEQTYVKVSNKEHSRSNAVLEELGRPIETIAHPDDIADSHDDVADN